MLKPVMGATEWAGLVTLSVLWGGSFFFVEVALVELGPLAIVFGRVGMAAIILLAYVTARGDRLPASPSAWGMFFVMAVLNNLVPFTLIAWGQVHIEGGLASILNATTPLFTVIGAHFLTADERMTPPKVMGILLGLFGVMVMIGPEALSGLGLHGLGQLAVLGAALSYALAGIYGRRLKDLSPGVAAAGMLTVSTVMMLPLVLIFEAPPVAELSAQTWAAMFGLALFSTAAAYLIYFRILASSGATNVLLVTFLIPVSGLSLGIAVLGEQPPWTAFLGMGLIFLGLAAVDGRPFRAARAALDARGGK